MASNADVKRVFLRLLEEDEEFRYAVAAKIGLLEILQKLEEHDRKFNEILAELREHRKKLEEHDRKFNEILKRLDRHEEENKKIWEEIHKIWKKLEEHDRKFNEILAELREHRKKLEEHDRKFNEILEILERHEKILRKHTQMLGALGSDIGALTEATLSRFARDDIIDEIKLRGVRVFEIRRMHKVNGYEVDLYIDTEDEVIVVEVKTRPSKRDVEKLSRVKDYLVKTSKKKVRAILASLRARTTLDIVGEARKNGVELIVY